MAKARSISRFVHRFDGQSLPTLRSVQPSPSGLLLPGGQSVIGKPAPVIVACRLVELFHLARPPTRIAVVHRCWNDRGFRGATRPRQGDRPVAKLTPAGHEHLAGRSGRNHARSMIPAETKAPGTAPRHTGSMSAGSLTALRTESAVAVPTRMSASSMRPSPCARRKLHGAEPTSR